jgi:predicted TIM-barrel fold metal-dependent hydrolase
MITTCEAPPPEASVAGYPELHRTLGVTRGVLIQQSVYGFDNRCMTDALEPTLSEQTFEVAIAELKCT